MKNLVSRSKGLMVLFLIFAMFSCNKDAPVRAVEKVNPKSGGAVNDRSECCGSFTVETDDQSNFPFSFEIWYYTNSGWQHTACQSSGTIHTITINACHNSGSTLQVLLVPCGSTAALPNPYRHFVVSQVNACDVYYCDPECFYFGYNTPTFVNPPPFPFSGYNLEANLCCN